MASTAAGSSSPFPGRPTPLQTGLNEKEEYLKEEWHEKKEQAKGGLRGFADSTASAVHTIFSPAVRPFAAVQAKIDAWRDHLDLPYPGQVDALGRECKTVHLNNFMFDGARADLSKSLNMNPAFQVTHSFTLGAQQASPMGGPAGPGGGTYNFAAIYASPKWFLQGGLDHEGSLNARMNYGWSPSDTTKIQANIQPSPSVPSMIQLEHDRAGRDYALNVKAYNPGVVDGTGVFMGSYLQSLTKRLAVGAEVIWQRPTPDMSEANLSYMAKYVGGANRDWIATAQLLGQGALQGTYWQRLSDKVEAGAEITLAPLHPSPRERKANATVAAKYDFRLATLRAQLDSTGKVSAFLEQRFTPAFAFLVTGEIDHWKNTSKFGVGIALESSTMDEAEAQAQAAAAQFTPPV